MPKVVMTHAVVDIERWLKGKAERHSAVSAPHEKRTSAASNSEQNFAPGEFSCPHAAQLQMCGGVQPLRRTCFVCELSATCQAFCRVRD
jgi:hypothetical protein